MRRKRKDEYHLLVAQNFLGNISLTGNHDDTKLRMFNTPGYKIVSPIIVNTVILSLEGKESGKHEHTGYGGGVFGQV